MNGTGNEQYISAEAVPMEDTRRGLISLREKHGADTAIGHHASNIIELIQDYTDCPCCQQGYGQLPALIKRQMDGLQRALQEQHDAV